MKRIFTISLFLFLLTFSSKLSAQFTQDDVKFWVGEGSQSAILVVDFRDGTTDPSFAFGFHYPENTELTFANMIEAVANAEPNFTFAQSNMGFLEDIIYNNHIRLQGDPDWWSTWSGNSAQTLELNGGTSEILANGGWYGVSYGFMGDEGPLRPTVTYPAYSSLWFSSEDVTYWIGEGENESVIVIDFNAPGEAPVTFAWGIHYNGTLTAQEALTQISDADIDLDVTITNNAITAITYNELTGTLNETTSWKNFSGTDMSDWVVNNDLQTALTNGAWFGTSFGNANTRRPFIPTAAQDNTAGVNHTGKNLFTAYPNPVKNVLTLKTEDAIINTVIINGVGQTVKSFKNISYLDVSDLSAGIYFVKVSTAKGSSVQKVIKE